MKTDTVNTIANDQTVNVRCLEEMRRVGRTRPFPERVGMFSGLLNRLRSDGTFTYLREVVSPMDRTVTIYDPQVRSRRQMLMFASNNYLGLANHPYVSEQVERSIRTYGTGLGGPPLLCGYSSLMRRLEERISAWKGREDTMIFPTGYMTNLGLVAGLACPQDRLIHDVSHHASLLDAARLSSATVESIPHNDTESLGKRLAGDSRRGRGTTFVAVEGVYSMDGDLAPLPEMVALCRRAGAILLLDDAHGSGVLGENGRGTADHFGVDKDVDVIMGTMSKAFAATGGFVSGSRDLIQYLRFFARPYMFSAALPPPALAAIIAGLDVIENDPGRRQRLLANARNAAEKLAGFGLAAEPKAAIIAVKAPPWLDVRKANRQFHKMGIFLNAIEYPAVSPGEERFRVSVTVDHTNDDIDRLAEAFEAVWKDSRCHLERDDLVLTRKRRQRRRARNRT